jgi:hypothetical protein
MMMPPHLQYSFDYSPQFWSDLGMKVLNKNKGGCNRTRAERFRTAFGTSWFICSILWHLLDSRSTIIKKPIHLLMALNYLKVYDKVALHCSRFKCDEKTSRKWTWIYIELISSLSVELVS